MKKIILSSLSIAVISLGGVTTFDYFKDSDQKIIAKQNAKIEKHEVKPKITNFGAKTNGFATFEELNKASTIVVKGTKVRELSTEIDKSSIDDSIIGGYTVTEFKINEVIKNSEGNPKIIEGEAISVGELAFENQNEIYTVNGYGGMKNGEDYLLFLEEEQGLFAPRGVVFGKVPLDTEDLEIYSTEDIGQVEGNDEEGNDEELLSDIFADAKEHYEEQSE